MRAMGVMALMILLGSAHAQSCVDDPEACWDDSSDEWSHDASHEWSYGSSDAWPHEHEFSHSHEDFGHYDESDPATARARPASASHCMNERARARISSFARVSCPVRKARMSVPGACSCLVPSGSSARVGSRGRGGGGGSGRGKGVWR